MNLVLRVHGAARRLLYFSLYAGAYSTVLHPSNRLWFPLCLTLYSLLAFLCRKATAPMLVSGFPRALANLLALLLTTSSLIVLCQGMAQAQFYADAQNFVVACFPAAAAAVPIVFNVLRFLFLIYLGVALIQSITAVREGQSLIAVATPPLIVVAVVTIGDIMSALIIGGATC